MPVTGPGVYGIVWGRLTTTLPSVVKAKKDTFNPVERMLTYCCNAWVRVLTTTPVSNTYTGVAGGTAVPIGTPVFFPAATTAGAQLMTALGWTGQYGPIIANALTTNIARATEAQAIYQPSPPPGGGLGTGLILPNNQAPLAATAGLFLVELATQFNSEGLFTVNGGLTIQIVNLMSALSGVYATMYSSMTTTIPIGYTGPTAPTPLVLPISPGSIK